MDEDQSQLAGDSPESVSRFRVHLLHSLTWTAIVNTISESLTEDPKREIQEVSFLRFTSLFAEVLSRNSPGFGLG